MKGRKVNRVLIVIAVVLIAAALYEVKLKPQSRPLYERALNLYRQEKYAASLLELERAYQIEPNSTGILVLRGWNFLKLRQYNDARDNFGRAARLDPKLVEPQLGLAYVALETGKGEAPLVGVRAMLEKDPSNRDFKLATAVALRQAGQNVQAAETFRDLEGTGSYGDVARRNLLEMYGLEGLNEKTPQGLPKLERPAQLQVDFRASGTYFQHREGSSWTSLYVKGVNLGPAPPGAFPSEAPNRADRYLDWLGQIAQMGANTIRTYSLLPPAFYRALKIHNEKNAASRLYLVQQVVLARGEGDNLFKRDAVQAAQAEIRHVVDAIHGQGDVPSRSGHGSGIYAVDVSPYTLGIVLGRVFEPHEVMANNELNSFRTTHDGKYVGVEKANPTEAWLASMADYAAEYETEKYNQQRALGIMNWPGLDPLSHPSEASLREEIAIRRNSGERSASIPSEEVVDDNDVVSVDETKFRARPQFQAGIFSAYSAFPFYPDFMYRDPAYLAVRDQQGPNPYFGYLKALKSHYQSLPVLVADYGASTSLGVSRLHPFGWNHGGLTEREQGDLLARMTRNIADAGLAGGAIASWQDEWYKANWLTRPLAQPEERRALWNNQLDADQGFGLWTYDPAGEALFTNLSGWGNVPPQYQKKSGGPATTLNDGWDADRTLRSLSVASDAAFVYLRLEVESLRKTSANTPDMKGAQYFIGIGTSPKRFGSETLPGLSPQIRSEDGANFLLHLGGGAARLLIASNYTPRENKPISGVSPLLQSGYRIPFAPLRDKSAGFEEIVVEINRRRFGRDGRQFPPQRHNFSTLRYRAPGQSDDTQATWSVDFVNKAYVFRIPWALLLVMDPSSHRVYARTEGGPQFVSEETKGFQVFAVSFRPSDPIRFDHNVPGGNTVADTLPSRDKIGVLTGLKIYEWPGWNTVNPKGRTKAGYPVVQKAFREVKAAS